MERANRVNAWIINDVRIENRVERFETVLSFSEWSFITFLQKTSGTEIKSNKQLYEYDGIWTRYLGKDSSYLQAINKQFN